MLEQQNGFPNLQSRLLKNFSHSSCSLSPKQGEGPG